MRRKLESHRLQRPTDERPVGSGMHAHVVVLSLDPFDLPERDDDSAPSVANHEAVPVDPRPNRVVERAQPALQFVQVVLSNGAAGPGNDRNKPLVEKGFKR